MHEGSYGVLPWHDSILECFCWRILSNLATHFPLLPSSDSSQYSSLRFTPFRCVGPLRLNSLNWIDIVHPEIGFAYPSRENRESVSLHRFARSFSHYPSLSPLRCLFLSVFRKAPPLAAYLNDIDYCPFLATFSHAFMYIYEHLIWLSPHGCFLSRQSDCAGTRSFLSTSCSFGKMIVNGSFLKTILTD